jgi:hypothetical protein
MKSIARELGRPVPEVTPEKGITPGKPDAKDVASLLAMIDEIPEVTVVGSTVTRYADGSLTDMMGYIQMQERASW